jgi:hypothetical protein
VRCEWRHPFYTSPYVKGTMWLWQKHTQMDWVLCVAGELHACVETGAGWTQKKLVKWLAPKIWLAEKPPCLELADIEWACEQYATQEVCGGRRWRGEGTFQFDFVVYETQDHGSILVEEDIGVYHRTRIDGPFAITFGVKDGMIQGEGAATSTLAAEWVKRGDSPWQCTSNGRNTVPLSVSGRYEDGKLKLIFNSSLEEYPTTTSCSSLPFGSLPISLSKVDAAILSDFFSNQNHPLVVVMEDGAEGQLVDDFSEETEQFGVRQRTFSIRLKSLPDH